MSFVSWTTNLRTSSPEYLSFTKPPVHLPTGWALRKIARESNLYWSMHSSMLRFNLTSIRAMSPPVLVPTMTSKTSFGVIGSSLPSSSSSIFASKCFRMTSVEMPRTPPPSGLTVSTRQWCAQKATYRETAPVCPLWCPKSR